MKVFIVGGRGNIGQNVALGLIRQPEIEEIILGDVSTDPAGLCVRLRKNSKVAQVVIDAGNVKDLAGMLKNADVAVNCAGPFRKTVLPVARAAVEAEVDYIDVCDDHEAALSLFASDLDEAASKAGITVLTGMGADPGTNNIIAKWYADRLERVDEIALFWAAGIDGMGSAAWEHSLRMTTGKIPQFLDGSIEYVEGGTGEETVRFPDPIGPCVVRYVGHPQPLTMPRYLKGLKSVVVKGALLPAWVDELIKVQKETGLLNETPIAVGGGIEVAPYDLALRLWQTIPANRDRGSSASALKVTVRGERKGRRETYTADMAGDMGPGTGLPAAIAVRMLGAGEIRVKGVVAPEGCIDPEKFLAALLQGGARIQQTKTVESMLDVPHAPVS